MWKEMQGFTGAIFDTLVAVCVDLFDRAGGWFRALQACRIPLSEMLGWDRRLRSVLGSSLSCVREKLHN